MADWKEKGVVPDSDDDDFEDSQSAGSDGGAHINHGSEISGVEGQDTYMKDISYPVIDVQSPVLPSELEYEAVCRRKFSVSPSVSPQAFRVPPTLNDMNEGNEQNESHTQDQRDMVDEISTSYVLFSSPLSSLTSSSPPALYEEEIASNALGIDELSSREGISNHDTSIGAAMEETRDIDMEEFFDLQSKGRRSLRQRNPIQLRPYALEGEKYRRSLMARGLKPLRLAQVQGDASRTTRIEGSPDPDFESEDDSQSQIFGQEPQSSAPSSQQSAHRSEADSLPRFHDQKLLPDEEEDEFPDIDELVDLQSTGFFSHGLKRQNTYASRAKQKIPRISKSLHRDKLGSKTTAITNISDVPASPPKTSSPLPPLFVSVTGRNRQSAMSVSTSSRGTSVEQDPLRSDTLVGILPTPATSVVKDTVDLTSMVSEGEEDHSLSDTASEPEFPVIGSNKSLHIKRVGKKIRGVLPASWLRLDAQTRKLNDPKPVSTRHTHSLSPIKSHPPSRKGVALPRYSSSKREKEERLNTSTTYFISDDESGDDINIHFDDHFEDSDLIPSLKTSNEFPHSGTASVVEDNYVDAMIPNRKRQSKFLSTTRHKRPALNSLFRHSHPHPTQQPRITEHLSTRVPRFEDSSRQRSKSDRKRVVGLNHRKNRIGNRSSRSYPPAPPNLSILDVIDPVDGDHEALPQFIRIAARKARSRRQLGRHSPTRKFIRLGNQDDTMEAQGILRDWREGTIGPRSDARLPRLSVQCRNPLSIMSMNDRNQNVRVPVTTERNLKPLAISRKARKPLITTPRQTRIESSLQSHFASSTPIQHKQLITDKHHQPPAKKVHEQIKKSRGQAVWARQAQLETSAAEHSFNHPSLAFGTNKKALDAIYRKGHKGFKIRGDIQLARFLADDDGVAQSTNPGIFDGENHTNPLPQDIAARSARPRKRTPKHLDSGAAKYRQPTEPMMLELLQPVSKAQEVNNFSGKLLGLGAYGSVYTYHFDTFPLPNTVFFHESTFIGSGRLSKALKTTAVPASCFADRGHILHRVADKQLRWGVWDAVVSSEVGICIEWMTDQLDAISTSPPASSGDDILGCLTFIVDYLCGYVSFTDTSCRLEALSRFTTLLQGMITRLEKWAPSATGNDIRQHRILAETMTLVLVIISQLRTFCSTYAEADVKLQLELILQRAATKTMQLLNDAGTSYVRKFYDDLQYLAIREQGVKSDSYVIQSWVMLMHVTETTHIPGASFWDLMNAQLEIDVVSTINDARHFEKLWYWMFSLLPLIEFNQLGVLLSGSRMSRSLENWALPQKIVKKIFELYTSKSRQSPGFNDYCRILFHRCHHLVEVWGWQKHGSIVGTFFDFFASHKLAHLRNEEVYKSPQFLENLDRDPSLSVETEDRCFHIFLKIIALSIKQLREANDTKAIRNLVARLLPNHDRQYPKEETIHQRDLASLRNHHDLLCTLFWAAPPALRPSVNLIRGLVDPSRCHTEAYLIHLQAWSNLARFILSSTPTASTYEPLAVWEQESFKLLIQQYNSVEADITDQLHTLSTAAKRDISQAYVSQVMERNRSEATMLQSMHLRIITSQIKNSINSEGVRLAMQPTSTRPGDLTLALHQFIKHHDQHTDPNDQLGPHAARLIRAYIERINELLPYQLSAGDGNTISQVEEDSQDYGDSIAISDPNLQRLEYIQVFDEATVALFYQAVRTCLYSRFPHQRMFSEFLVQTWAMLVDFLCEDRAHHNYSDFVAKDGKFSIFNFENTSITVRYMTSAFYTYLANSGRASLTEILTLSQDPVFGTLYLLLAPKPKKHDIDVGQHGHKLLPYFLASDPILTVGSNGLVTNYDSFFDANIYKEMPLAKFNKSEVRLDMIKAILSRMSACLRSSNACNAIYPNVSQREIHKRFVQVVMSVQKALKRELVTILNDKNEDCSSYEGFARDLLGLIKACFSSFCEIDSWFTLPTDPRGLEDDIKKKVELTSELADTTGLQQELNFLCLSIIKKEAVALFAASASHLQDSPIIALTDQLIDTKLFSGTGPSRFECHFLVHFAPSFLQAAFHSEIGTLVAKPFFEAVSKRITMISDRGDTFLALKLSISTLRSLTDGIILLAKLPDKIVPWTFSSLDMLSKFAERIFIRLWILAKAYSGTEEAKEVLAHLGFFHHFAAGIGLSCGGAESYDFMEIASHDPSCCHLLKVDLAKARTPFTVAVLQDLKDWRITNNHLTLRSGWEWQPVANVRQEDPDLVTTVYPRLAAFVSEYESLGRRWECRELERERWSARLSYSRRQILARYPQQHVRRLLAEFDSDAVGQWE